MGSEPRELFHHIFGDGESIVSIEARAKRTFGERSFIVWEGDPETFEFKYVSASAEKVLGYPAEFWLKDAFWANTIVHPADRADAIAYCALATAKGRDHDFVYRAVKANGSTVWLHDVVKVILGANGIPARLQGLMFEVASGDQVTPVFEKVKAQAVFA